MYAFLARSSTSLPIRTRVHALDYDQPAGDSVGHQGEGLDERRRVHTVARAASYLAAAARTVLACGDPAAWARTYNISYALSGPR